MRWDGWPLQVEEAASCAPGQMWRPVQQQALPHTGLSQVQHTQKKERNRQTERQTGKRTHRLKSGSTHLRVGPGHRIAQHRGLSTHRREGALQQELGHPAHSRGAQGRRQAGKQQLHQGPAQRRGGGKGLEVARLGGHGNSGQRKGGRRANSSSTRGPKISDGEERGRWDRECVKDGLGGMRATAGRQVAGAHTEQRLKSQEVHLSSC